MSLRTADGREVVFIHIPKAAGTSVWQVVGHPGGVAETVTHETAARWRRFLGPERYDHALTFAVIRNPYDRFLATWHYLATQTEDHRYWPGDTREREWMQGLGRDVETVAANMPTEAVTDLRNAVHFGAQTQYLCIDGRCGVSQVLRFEHLAGDWQAMAEKFGLPPTLPHVNRTPGRRPALSDDAKARIADLYAADFAFLREVYQP